MPAGWLADRWWQVQVHTAMGLCCTSRAGSGMLYRPRLATRLFSGSKQYMRSGMLSHAITSIALISWGA